MQHEDYMRRALELAQRGMGFTSPNPMVGAVIVRDDKIIGDAVITANSLHAPMLSSNTA